MEWTACRDQMPPEETDVLCWRSNGMPPIVAGIFHGDFADDDSGMPIRGTVTHWMPLPEAPN